MVLTTTGLWQNDSAKKGGLIFKQGNYTVWSVKSRIPLGPFGRCAIDQKTEMPAPRGDTRRRILDAAQDLARSTGPGNLSLDAVAAQAGVSKGGLLYHFPSKNRLMEALVEDHLSRFDAALSAQEKTGRPDAAICAYIAQFMADRKCGTPPPSGLLAALAEDPGMLGPVRRQERDFLGRIRANATDPQMATLAFLAIQGLRAMELLNTQVLDRKEEADLVDWLNTRLQTCSASDSSAG